MTDLPEPLVLEWQGPDGREDTAVAAVLGPAGPAGPTADLVWGGIDGSLADQADLVEALEAKADAASTADALATKADAAATAAALATKAVASDVADALALKANLADVDAALAEKADLDSPGFTGAPTAPTPPAADNSTRVASTAYVDAAVAAIIASADAMVFKGSIDCSGNPNYPAADAGWTYKVGGAGRIGGAAGARVEVGDTLLCTVDGSAAGTQAAVGANWTIVQANLDGAVIGPAAAVDGHVAIFDGASGKLLKDSGLLLSGNNTGDQTSIVGISGALAEFNAALTDADFATLAGIETLSGKTLASPTLTGLAQGDRIALAPAANTTGLSIAGHSLTGANAQSILSLASVWNTTGTPTGLDMSITDTASNPASLPVNVRVNGTSIFNLNKNGDVEVPQSAAYNLPSFKCAGFETGVSIINNTLVSIVSNGIGVGSFKFNQGLLMKSSLPISWSTADVNGAGDIGVGRVAAGVLGINDGANGGGALQFTKRAAPGAAPANTCRIYAKDNGAGKTRLVVLMPDGVETVLATES